LTSDFTVELVSNAIVKLKRGKAADLNNLTAEHFHYCHQIIATILCKLFNLILSSGRIPAAFGHSYTVPVSKVQDSRTKTVTTNDFNDLLVQSYAKYLNTVQWTDLVTSWSLLMTNLASKRV